MVGQTRPLSGGGWSLLGWLRREDRGSSDSLASDAGSFAYLPPPTAPQSVTRAPPSPTPSCTRRLQDIEFRRLADRNLTLHRKYRLPLGAGFDNYTLPPPRRVVQDRERRAASESLPRPAHVPGKRRAPPPPRGRTIKRRAPPPPAPVAPIPEDHEDSPEVGNENIPADTVEEKRVLKGGEGRKQENVKKEEQKLKPEKERSFLKQIFENKKRHSAIETPQVKLLSTISELDRQAAELMQSYKLQAYESNHERNEMKPGESRGSSSKSDSWFCTRCLKKYDSTMVTCLDCMSQAHMSAGSSKYKDTCLALKRADNQTNTGIVLNNIWNNSSSSNKNTEDKQKLKEMLKEMKDSLPKRPKPDKNEGKKSYFNRPQHTYEVIENKETPTLPMGASMHRDVADESISKLSTDKPSVSTKYKEEDGTPKTIHASPVPRRATETVLITQTTVLVDHIKIPQQSAANTIHNKKEAIENKIIHEKNSNPSSDKTMRTTNVINQPFKISSLLNPVYIPKKSTNNDRTVYSQKEIFLLQDNTRLTRETSTAVVTSGGSSSGTPVEAPIKFIPLDNLAKTPSNSAEQTNKSPTSVQPLATKIQVVTPEKTIVPTASLPVTIKEEAAKENLPSPRIKSREEVIPTSAYAEALKVTSATSQQRVAIIQQSSTATENTPSTSDAMTPNVSPMLGRGFSSTASDQHSKRRDLINQLESSIAKGDEKAAADAAIRLAQLRLSCSVLSFTSQIMNDALPTTRTEKATASTSKVSGTKVDSSTQSVGTRCTKTFTEASKISTASNRNDGKFSQTSAPITIAENSNKDPNETPRPSTSKSDNVETKETVTISVWVEDRAAARGPVPLLVPRSASMAALRLAAERRLGLPAALQRWIVDRALCTSDEQLRRALAGKGDDPFYLCLVEQEDKLDTPQPEPALPTNTEAKPSDVYSELMALELQGLVPNTDRFECGVCLEQCEVGAGGVIRACAHSFCRDCLRDAVRHSSEPAVACPAVGCDGLLEEREVRRLCSAAEHAAWLARGLAAAELGSTRAFHCRTRDCAGWALCDAGVRAFPCPVCRAANCVPCQAIHTGSTCEEHRSRLKAAAAACDGSADADADTAALLDKMIEQGEALPCPECNAVITKKWGCDWVRCPACRTELCWVTRGRRWGPAGRGDSSAGCRCGEGGRRCHPACHYCH